MLGSLLIRLNIRVSSGSWLHLSSLLVVPLIRTHYRFSYVWLIVHHELYLYNKPTRCTVFSLYCVTTPLHVSGPFVTHHQEAECIMWRIVLVFLLSRLSAGLDQAKFSRWWKRAAAVCLSGTLVPTDRVRGVKHEGRGEKFFLKFSSSVGRATESGHGPRKKNSGPP
jgi:hypothetical protein